MLIYVFKTGNKEIPGEMAAVILCLIKVLSLLQECRVYIDLNFTLGLNDNIG